MNLTGTSPRQEVVTQESLLLDAAERIGRIREGRVAYILHLSKLRPQNRQDAQLRIAVRILEPTVVANRGQIFLLGNCDIVFTTKDAYPTDIENLVYKLRALFNKDPLTFSDSGDGVDRFYTRHDLEYDYEGFLVFSRKMAEEAKRRSREAPSVGQPQKPLDPKSLGGVLDRMGTIDVAGIVRRQSAVGMTDRNTIAVMFQEFFVSVGDLQRVVAPDCNLLTNRWLFQHLSLTLDQRMMGVIGDLALRKAPETISLNFNVGTIATPAFRALAQSGQVKLVIEFQVVDAFADIGAYFQACDFLHDYGHKVLLDGLNPMSLHFMDVARYRADLFKVAWSPELPDGDHPDELRDAFAEIGMDPVILTRCDSEQSLQWAMTMGISKFQGRYVDAMLSAVTMARCDKSAHCTFAQCIQRRGVITGKPRAECGNLDRLDGLPEVTAPSRRKAGVTP
ncbi:MAG: hypothetical protein HQL38_11055 [Alphaproteobacteria bacterium]|nr:hypothetical protein [Alphaproteobacteria bacterium]